ncbi:hypothetical protein SAMN04488095_2739 [Jannaschia pohangensis]|uniref:Uncharacterized protein n=1 Tax=Jannaschia pohangensis TaxID=390807 RepID=A0A1I3R3A9_9RHOB|nr:hypothetical protein SAMN04488095_2739 [Jannaschia pohangensis]
MPCPVRPSAVPLGALLVTVAATLTAHPSSADVTDACAVTAAFPEAVAQLEGEGWTVLTRDADLTPEQIDALAWTLMTGYIAGDDGGEDIATLLDLQRKAVPGLLLRRDTDTTRSRVLVQGNDALTLVQTRTIPGRVERVCRLAATEAPEGLDLIEAEGAPALAEITTVLPEVK